MVSKCNIGMAVCQWLSQTARAPCNAGTISHYLKIGNGVNIKCLFLTVIGVTQ